jgi:hypothetical protein
MAGNDDDAQVSAALQSLPDWKERALRAVRLQETLLLPLPIEVPESSSCSGGATTFGNWQGFDRGATAFCQCLEQLPQDELVVLVRHMKQVLERPQLRVRLLKGEEPMSSVPALIFLLLNIDHVRLSQPNLQGLLECLTTLYFYKDSQDQMNADHGGNRSGQQQQEWVHKTMKQLLESPISPEINDSDLSDRMMGDLGFSECDMCSAVANRALLCMDHGVLMSTQRFESGKLTTKDAHVLHAFSAALKSVLERTSLSELLASHVSQMLCSELFQKLHTELLFNNELHSDPAATSAPLSSKSDVMAEAAVEPSVIASVTAVRTIALWRENFEAWQAQIDSWCAETSKHGIFLSSSTQRQNSTDAFWVAFHDSSENAIDPSNLNSKLKSSSEVNYSVLARCLRNMREDISKRPPFPTLAMPTPAFPGSSARDAASEVYISAPWLHISLMKSMGLRAFASGNVFVGSLLHQMHHSFLRTNQRQCQRRSATAVQHLSHSTFGFPGTHGSNVVLGKKDEGEIDFRTDPRITEPPFQHYLMGPRLGPLISMLHCHTTGVNVSAGSFVEVERFIRDFLCETVPDRIDSDVQRVGVPVANSIDVENSDSDGNESYNDESFCIWILLQCHYEWVWRGLRILLAVHDASSNSSTISDESLAALAVVSRYFAPKCSLAARKHLQDLIMKGSADLARLEGVQEMGSGSIDEVEAVLSKPFFCTSKLGLEMVLVWAFVCEHKSAGNNVILVLKAIAKILMRNNVGKQQPQASAPPREIGTQQQLVGMLMDFVEAWASELCMGKKAGGDQGALKAWLLDFSDEISTYRYQPEWFNFCKYRGTTLNCQ